MDFLPRPIIYVIEAETEPLEGVYLVQDPAGVVVYIGLARNVRARLRQHRRSLTAGLGRSRAELEDWTVRVFPGDRQAERELIQLYKPMLNYQYTGRKKWLDVTLGGYPHSRRRDW